MICLAVESNLELFGIPLDHMAGWMAGWLGWLPGSLAGLARLVGWLAGLAVAAGWIGWAGCWAARAF